MSYFKYFGFENYRNFQSFIHFDLSPITILTGKNNSGKSSFFKALLLLKNSATKYKFLEYISFKGGNHYLAYFENILNKDDTPLIFSLPFTFLNQTNFVIHLMYEKAENKQKNYIAKLRDVIIESIDNSVTLLSIKFLPILEQEKKGEDNLLYKIEFYLNGKLYKELLDKYIELSKTYDENEEYENFMYDMESDYDNNRPTRNDSFYERVSKDRVDFIDYENIKLIATENEIHEIESYKNDIFDHIESITKLTSEYFSSRIFWGRELMFSDENIAEPLALFERFFPIEKAVGSEKRDMQHLFIKHISIFLSNGFKLLTENLVKNLSQLNSIRSNSERLYSADGNSFNELIRDFTELYDLNLRVGIEWQFIDEWMVKFDIGGMKHLEITSFPEFNINGVFLKKNINDKQRRPLIDLGFGISQLVSILIKIVVEIKGRTLYQSNTILVEEPEANLHPKYQSLLADLFIDAAYRFGTQFILETHSEYILRRFQYWYEQGHINNDVVTIYNIDPLNPKNIIKKLTIDSIGNIKQELGNSFFDELTTLKDELSKIQEISKLKDEINRIRGSAICVVFSEDEDSEPLNNVLKASGFIAGEFDLYSYKGCTKIESAILLSEYIREKFPNLKILIYKDRDYESDKEINKWKQDLQMKNIIPLVPNGNEIECYYVNANHINYHHNEITPEQAEDFINQLIENNKIDAINSMKIHEYGIKNKDKNSILEKWFDVAFNENKKRWSNSKTIFKSLKQKIKDITKVNSKIHIYSDYLADIDFKEIASKIWS